VPSNGTFEPCGSLFVVFRADARGFDPVVAFARDGAPVSGSAGAAGPIEIRRAVYGLLDDPGKTRDVRAKVQALVDAGTTAFGVARLADGDDPAYGVVKTLTVDYACGGRAFSASATDPETVSLAAVVTAADPAAELRAGPDDQPVVEAAKAGRYELRTAGGKTKTVELPAPPAPVEIGGPWDVAFEPARGGPAAIRFDRLEDWAKRPEPGIRHYAGTAVYRTTFDGPAANAPGAAAPRHYLDLGDVAVMAEMKLNGKDLGILWKPPYRVDVTGVLRAKANELEVRVVNLWINRLIGDEELPEDSERNANGTLKAWPAWVLEGKPSPAGRLSFTSHRLWKKGDPLVPSGLIGPVTVRTTLVGR